MREYSHLAANRAIETLRQAELDAVENRDRRGIEAAGFGDYARARRVDLRRNAGRPRIDPIGPVPGLARRRRREQPGFGSGDFFARRDDRVNQTGLDRGLSGEASSFEQNGKRPLATHEARQTDRKSTRMNSSH